MSTENFEKNTIVRHTHIYKMSPSRPAETMAAAESDATSFSSSGISPEATAFSDTVIKVRADGNTGEMFAYWIQGGASNEQAYPSTATKVEESRIHLYAMDAEYATSSKVRAVLDAAELDARKFAEENHLEFDEDIVALSHDGEQIVVMWSTESEN